MDLTREELLLKLGAARAKARAAWRLVDVEVAPQRAAFSYALNPATPLARRAKAFSFAIRGRACSRSRCS